MARPKTDLLVVSPYFAPGGHDETVCRDPAARRAGAGTDQFARFQQCGGRPPGYARYREALIAMGVEMYEMRAEQRGSVFRFCSSSGRAGGSRGASRASLHAKAVAVDTSLLVVSSMNLALRYELQNSEVAVIIRSRKLAREVTALIEPGMTQGVLPGRA